MARVLIVNGSLGGVTGNTGEALAVAEDLLKIQAEVETLDLSQNPHTARILDAASRADGFLFGTGTYWDNWGSPLQQFFEVTAHTEGSNIWLGKPAAIIATAHAVGAKSLISRLMGVVNVYGMTIPPMAGLGITYVNQTAFPHATEHLKNELWTSSDIGVVAHNLLEAMVGTNNWAQWPTNCGRYSEKWLTCYSDRIAAESNSEKT